MFKKKLILVLLYSCFIQLSLAMTPTNNYLPQMTIDSSAFDNNLMQLDYLQPLYNNNQQIIFLDARANDTFANQEGYALGTGYRTLTLHNQMIFGLYGFVQHEQSINDQPFYQGNLGLELLSNPIDFRINGYIPFERSQTIDSYLSLPENQIPFVGHKIILQTYLNQAISLPGFDIEIGAPIPHFNQLKLFLGYYHYGFEHGVSTIAGPRVRLEYRINPVITLTASEQYDHIQGNETLFGLRFTLGKPADDNNDLVDRLKAYIINQPYVITEQQTNLGKQIESPQNIYFVNNAATNGDGTYQSPYNNLSQAVNAANSNNNQNIIYIFQGNQIYQLNGTLNLPANLLLTTSGTNLTYQGILLLPGNEDERPTLAGGLNLANNDDLNSFNLVNYAGSGLPSGIVGNGVSNITINDLQIGTNGSDEQFYHAIDLTNTQQTNAQNISITNSMIQANNFVALNSSAYAISMDGYNNINLTNDTFSAKNTATLPTQTATATAISITHANNVLLKNLNIDANSSATYSAAYGINLFATNQVNINQINAQVIGSNSTGIFIGNSQNFIINQANLAVTGDLAVGVSLINSNTGIIRNVNNELSGNYNATGFFINNSQGIQLINPTVAAEISYPYNAYAVYATNNSDATITQFNNLHGDIIAGPLGTNIINFPGTKLGPDNNGIITSGQAINL